MSEAAIADTAVAQPRAQVGKRIRTLGFDPLLLVVITAMVAFGLVMVYSASWDVSWRLFQDPNALFRRQLFNLSVGLVVMAVAAWMPIRWLRKLALPIIGASVLLLIAPLVMSAGSGPHRSILGGSVQPSEVATLALIIYLSVWMESKGDRLTEWGYGFIPLMMITGVVDGLVLLQPDLSVVLTAGLVALAMFYLAGARAHQSLLVTFGGGAVGYLLVRVTNTGRERWQEFMNGLIDVDKASYHVQHSLQAFYSGGIFGRGLGL